MSEEQHIYHHNDRAEYYPAVSVTIEKNTKGFNYSASVSGCATVEQAMQLLNDAAGKLATQYGGNVGSGS